LVGFTARATWAHIRPIWRIAFGCLTLACLVGLTAIVIDLRDLTFMDTTGLRAFLAARNRAEENGRGLLLVGAKEPVRRIFEITGQDHVLDNEDAVSVLDP
jgi:anti-anti-sigma factor